MLPTLNMDYSLVMPIASADLDNGQSPDYAILYSHKKIDFYFSSDQERGTLPIGNVNISLTLALPPSCAKGQSIRFVDINNSGKVDLIVSCLNVDPILVYTQGLTKDSWTVTHKAAEAAAQAQERSAEAIAKQRLAEEKLAVERKSAAV